MPKKRLTAFVYTEALSEIFNRAEADERILILDGELGWGCKKELVDSFASAVKRGVRISIYAGPIILTLDNGENNLIQYLKTEKPQNVKLRLCDDITHAMPFHAIRTDKFVIIEDMHLPSEGLKDFETRTGVPFNPNSRQLEKMGEKVEKGFTGFNPFSLPLDTFFIENNNNIYLSLLTTIGILKGKYKRVQ